MEDAAIPSQVAEATNGDGDVDMDENPKQEDGESALAAKKEVKLEELFADVDSDEEFPSSAPAPQPTSSPPSAAPASPM